MNLFRRSTHAACRTTVVALFLTISAFGQWQPLNPVTGFDRAPDGVVFHMASGTLKLQVCSDAILRVRYSATADFSDRPEYVVLKTSWPPTAWNLQSTDQNITLVTARMKATVTRVDGVIVFTDLAGKRLMTDASRKLTPVEVNGEKTYRSETAINVYGSPEAFYGLGQHQAGVWNYRGESVDISEDNTNIAVLFLVSGKGYGIFWIHFISNDMAC